MWARGSPVAPGGRDLHAWSARPSRRVPSEAGGEGLVTGPFLKRGCVTGGRAEGPAVLRASAAVSPPVF